ncbi:MAG: RHS repeat-associated core domain-containing protein [Candidatus Cryosericum sp.]
MRKGIRLVVSLLVVVAFVAACCINQALADEVVSRIARPAGVADRVELAASRSRFKREYLNPNGTVTAEFSSTPLCYQDETETWKPLDPSLVTSRETAGGFDNNGMSFSTRLRPMNDGKDGYLTVARGNHALSFSLQGAQSVRPSKGDALVEYKGALPGVTIRCLLQDDALKEDVVLDVPPVAPFALRYGLKLTGLTAQAEKDGSLTFHDDRTGDLVFLMSPLFMTDTAGHRSTDISVGWDGTTLVVTPDPRFLADPSTVYPVVIDPSITLSEGAASLACASVRTSSANTTFSGLYVGLGAPPTGITSYGLIQADLNALPPKIDISSAILSLTCTGWEGGNPGNDPWISGHKVTSSWSPETVTWNTQPAQSPDALFSRNPTQQYPNDITAVVRDWLLDPGTNHGIALSFPSQTSVTYRYATSLSVTYAQRLGTEDYWSVQKLRDSRQYAAAVNAANGNLIVRMQDLDWSAYGLANPVLCTYNSLSLQDGPFGFGWTSSLCTRMTMGTTESRILQDEDGTFHEFTFQGSSAFRCPEIPDYMEEHSGTLSGTLKNKKTQTARVFGDDGRILSYQDWCQNSYTYTYDVSGKLASVTDPAGRSLTFTYNADGRVVRMQDWSLRQWFFAYDGDGNMISSTDAMSRTTSFQWAPGHLLTSITDPRGGVFLVNIDATSGRLLSCVDDLDATSYTLQVSPDSTFATTVVNQVTKDTSITLPSLAGNTPYYWRVNAANGSAPSPWSSVGTLVTPVASGAPQVPVPISPADMATIATVAPTLSWSVSTGADLYTVQVGTSAAFDTSVISQSVTSPLFTTPSLADATTYYWRVRASSAGGCLGWSSVQRFTPPPLPTAPSLSSPVNGTTTSTTTPTLAWTASSGATSYTLQVSAVSTFATTVVNQSVTTVSFTIPTLANATTYYWRVNAVNAVGTGFWSGAWSFVTPALAPPVPSSPATGTTTSTLTPTLTWTASSGATSYTVQVSTISTFATTVVNQNVATASYTTPALANATVYYWRVNALNAGSTSSWSGAWSFTTAAPGPMLLSPANGTTTSTTTPTLAWDQSSTNASYTLQVSTVSTFATTVVNQSLTTTSYTTPALSNATAYYWRVNATNTAGTSLWSSVWSFTVPTGGGGQMSTGHVVRPMSRGIPAIPVPRTLTIMSQPPSPPVLTYPYGGSTINTQTPTLSWYGSSGTAFFTVQVSTTSGFGASVIISRTTTATSLTTPALDNARTYYWRVNATSDGGVSSWSSVSTFTTPSQPPLVPTLSAPAYLVTIPASTATPTLVWNPVSGASSYVVQVGTDSTFTTTIADQTLWGSSSFTTPALAPATVYYWRVKAGNSAAWSAWSSIWHFTTPSAPAVPTLAGCTSIAPTLTATWNPVPGATFYSFQKTDEGPYCWPSSPCGAAGTSFTFNATSGVTYYWRVRAVTAFGTSAWSSDSYVTAVTAPLQPPAPPVLSGPASGTTVATTTPTLTWNFPPGTISSWTVQVSTVSTFATTLVNQSVTTPSFTTPSLGSAPVYYWRVSATNAAGASPWSFIWSFRNPAVLPTAPVPFSPAHRALTATAAPTLRWNAVTGASSYTVQISQDSTFGVGLITTQTTTGTSFAAPTLGNSTTYWWRVSATNAAGTSPWSPAWSFLTPSAAGAPVLVSPGNGSAVTTLTPGFMWNAYPGASSYLFQLSASPSFAGFLVSSTTGGNTWSSTPTLTTATSYYWRVQVTMPGGATVWYDTWTFHTRGSMPVQLPVTPVLLSPANGTTVGSLTPTLAWRGYCGGTTLSYDSAAATTYVTDARGGQTAVTMNAWGNPLTIVDPVGATSTFTWVGPNRLDRATDPRGGYTTVTWIDWNVMQVQDPAGIVTQYTYNSLDQPVRVDQAGAVTTYTCTSDGAHVASMTDAEGRLHTYTYTARGLMTAEYQNDQLWMTYAYDTLGNCTSTTNAQNVPTTRVFDSDNRGWCVAETAMLVAPSTQGGAVFRTTSWTYDAAGEVLTQTAADGGVTHFTYDADGNRTTQLDPLNNLTTWTYDLQNRLLAQTDPTNGTTNYTYDIDGNQTGATLPAGQSQSMHYDLAGRLIQVVDANGVATTYAYDVSSNLTSVQSGSFGKTFTYDAANRPSQVYENGVLIAQYTYDAHGDTTQVVDARGIPVASSYNGLHELTGTASPTGTNTGLTYNARGDLTALASSSSGPQTFTYDTLRRLTGSTDATGYQVQYAYDAGSRLTAETTPSGTATFAWDLLDRATQVTDPQNHVTSYTYDTAGRRLAMLSPGALATQYTYDASSRITELKLVNSTTQAQLLDTLTTYDANGNALASGPDAYTYDSTQQLASWTRSGVQTSYTCDARGNLTSMTGPSGTTSFTVDPATNRLLTMTVPGQYTDTWTYDAAGNPLTRSRSQNGTTQISSYSWDAAGKLSSVIRQGQTTLTFAYAPDGTLTRKEQGTQVTTYAHDFAGVSRESTTSSAPITYQHNGAGELVSLTWNNQTYYYHFNAHGDTIALSDSTGTPVAQYSYDPWGTLVTNTNPSLPNPYLYCGAYGVRWDADLSLYLMGARWYNPSTGRFLTKDSYPPDLLAPITQNPYQYCGNNPITYVDSNGHVFMLVTAAVGALLGGVVGAICSYKKTGSVTWRSVAAGAAIGGAIGLTAGAAAAYVVAGSATASTGAVIAGATVARTASGTSTATAIAKTVDYLVENAESLKRSGTVMTEVAERPYIDSTSIIREIMQSGTAVQDGGLETGLKWVTSGMWNGSEGTWTLVVDVATQTIIHFQFRSH